MSHPFGVAESFAIKDVSNESWIDFGQRLAGFLPYDDQSLNPPTEHDTGVRDGAYLDTADVTAVKRLARILPLHGVTTNPSIVAKEGKPIWEVLPALRDASAAPASCSRR